MRRMKKQISVKNSQMTKIWLVVLKKLKVEKKVQLKTKMKTKKKMIKRSSKLKFLSVQARKALVLNQRQSIKVQTILMMKSLKVNGQVTVNQALHQYLNQMRIFLTVTKMRNNPNTVKKETSADLIMVNLTVSMTE